MAKKYLAVFPSKWGDEIRRVYKSEGAAIGQAKRHLHSCEDCNTSHRAEVWEYGSGKRLIWAEES